MITGWALALFAQLTITPNEDISLDLIGGDTVTGRVATIRPDGLHVTTERGLIWVEASLVSQANFTDRQLAQADLVEEIGKRLEYELGRIEGRYALTPRPAVVAVASAVLPGAGQALLGQNKEAKGFIVADLVVLGLGSYLWFVQNDRGAAVPLFALDLIFRTSSATQAYRLSQRRRALREASQQIYSGISQ